MLTFLEGYQENLKFELRVYNFSKGINSNEVYRALFGNEPAINNQNCLVRSFNRVYYDAEKDQYRSEIHLDTHNNFCYARFAVVKEACHLFFTLSKSIENKYPFTSNEVEVFELLREISSSPFSLKDFDNDSYSSALKIENAAELLAYLLMVGDENLARDREAYFNLSREEHLTYDHFLLARLRT